MKLKDKKLTVDIYSIVNNRIIELLKKGVVPWRQPWDKAGHPKNLLTGKPYQGINVILLSSLHYAQNYFLTFKQVQEIGATVKKGEKSEIVIFWKWYEKENEKTKEKESIPVLKYFRVFNIAQCIDIPKEMIPPAIERKNNPIKECDKIIKEMPLCPEIRHNKHRAYYSPDKDYINMPKPDTFISSEEYFGTLFHELVHSTGHATRLNREDISKNTFGSEGYSKEELIAELGASYLKAHAGLPASTTENNTAYIQNWLTILNNDRRFIVQASSQAQKAVDYILQIEPQSQLGERSADLHEIRKNKKAKERVKEFEN